MLDSRSPLKRFFPMDITHIKQELCLSPRKTLQTGLLETVKWYLDHSEWVDAIRKQADYNSWIHKNYGQR